MILELLLEVQPKPERVIAETDEEAVNFTAVSVLRYTAWERSIRALNDSAAFMRWRNRKNSHSYGCMFASFEWN